MSNYFYYPLGDFAENYINNTATTNERPHSYTSHGWNKIDFGVGGGHQVYSMTNGVITTCGYLGSDDWSIYGVVVKTIDCGYSRMMAKIKGGTVDNYPLYFTYIEMASLNPDLSVGMTVTKGTFLGITNNKYSGSALHFDIQPYDRYSGDNGGNAENWYGCVTLEQKDAYGDKGSQYSLKDHLDPHFTLDENGNLKDHTGQYMGVESNGIYYPSDSQGNPLPINTTFTNMSASDVDYIGGNTTKISKWYAYSILLQTPIKLEKQQSNESESNANSSNLLKINMSEEWEHLLVGVVAAECSWSNLAVAHAILLVARNWIYAFNDSVIDGDNSTAAQKIYSWGHGKTKSQLLSLYETYKDKSIEGINTVEFVKMIMSGTHYTFAEKYDKITYYNQYSAKDIEDITGFPGDNELYKNRWVCFISFTNRFVNWSFVGPPKDKVKPSVLLGLQ